VLTGHAQIFGLRGFMTALWTTHRLSTSVLEPFTAHVILTVTDLSNTHSPTDRHYHQECISNNCSY